MMKYVASNRRIMTIAVIVLGMVVVSIALSSYMQGLKLNPNFILDSNKIYSSSSSFGFVPPLQPPQPFEAYAQTFSQNNTDMSLRQLFERTQQSVVQVTSETDPTLLNQNLPSRSATLGSGFVYDTQGHIVTNYHVVVGARNPENIVVTFSDGSVYRGRVIGTDQYSDLAVLEIEDQSAIQKMVPPPIGNSSQLYVGDQVVAIGNPFGLTGTMTSGIISGLGRLLPAYEEGGFPIPNIIQTDTPVNPGNSGGPLLNIQGEVVGITTAIFSTTGAFAGVGFAFPSNAITKIASALIEEGSFEHPWLGITAIDLTPSIANVIGLQEARGVLVANVVEGGPADIAGIQGGNILVQIGGREVQLGGDLILAVDNTATRKIDDLLGYIEESTEVGESITLTIWRDGEINQLNATLGARPSQEVSR
jgi:S1-C subfamily serine protease